MTPRWVGLLLAVGLLALVGCAPDRSSDTTAGQTPDAPSSPSPSDTADEPAAASPRGDDAPVVQQGRVVDVVDGDTFELSGGTTVRIAIADTPEVFGGTEPCGPAASDFTASFLAGETVAIYRPDGAPPYDPFERLLGEVVRVSDDASLNVALVRAGLATVDERFTDEDPDLAQRLRTAAQQAQTPSCARPQPSEAAIGGTASGSVSIDLVREDGPGDDVEQYNDSEYVQLRNDGAADVDLAGWRIVDLAGNEVRIDSGFTIPAGGTFRVYSGDGENDPTARFFAGLGQAYLNNSGGDTIRLLDTTGTEVATFSFT